MDQMYNNQPPGSQVTNYLQGSSDLGSLYTQYDYGYPVYITIDGSQNTPYFSSNGKLLDSFFRFKTTLFFTQSGGEVSAAPSGSGYYYQVKFTNASTPSTILFLNDTFVNVLVVAGGGSGGGGNNRDNDALEGAGGGGGGGVYSGTLLFTAYISYTATVGGGGIGQQNTSNNGGNSLLSDGNQNIGAYGGGGGGPTGVNLPNHTGKDGGSGGGGCGYSGRNNGGSSINNIVNFFQDTSTSAIYWNNLQIGTASSLGITYNTRTGAGQVGGFGNQRCGGAGGGGNGAAGASSNNLNGGNGGNGGNGSLSAQPWIDGNYYGAGGGGGAGRADDYSSGTPGLGGTNGGGNGGLCVRSSGNNNGLPATFYGGGGGGCGSIGLNGGNGYQGIIILLF